MSTATARTSDAAPLPEPAAPSIWSYPTRILFGPGSSSAIGAEAHGVGMQRALIVSDPGVAGAGLLEAAQQSLERQGIVWRLFTRVSTNPTEAEVDSGTDAYREHAAEGVVAIGGGAPLDVAKLIVVRASVPRSFEELDDAKGGDRFIPARLPPVIAVPTTAGTGSEVGRAGSIAYRARLADHAAAPSACRCRLTGCPARRWDQRSRHDCRFRKAGR
jgi:alcohol dehydrogenase class IV